MAFVKFVATRKGTFQPKASISAIGLLSFNLAANEVYDFKSKPYVTLYYDPDTSRIGLKFSPTDEQGSKKLSSRPRSGSTLHIASFLKEFGLEHNILKTYELKPYDDYLTLDLRHPLESRKRIPSVKT